MGAEGLGFKERGGGASSDDMGGRLSGFVNLNGNWGEKDATDREDSFDFKSVGILAGADYRFSNNLVGGAAVNFSRTEADVTSGGGGETDRPSRSSASWP